MTKFIVVHEVGGQYESEVLLVVNNIVSVVRLDSDKSLIYMTDNRAITISETLETIQTMLIK